MSHSIGRLSQEKQVTCKVKEQGLKQHYYSKREGSGYLPIWNPRCLKEKRCWNVCSWQWNLRTQVTAPTLHTRAEIMPFAANSFEPSAHLQPWILSWKEKKTSLLLGLRLGHQVTCYFGRSISQDQPLPRRSYSGLGKTSSGHLIF